MESPSMPNMCLTEPDLSITECNCQSESWSDWHLNLLTETSTKTHLDEPKRVEERERAKNPIKDAEDQLWIWFDHLLQSRICQIQLICFRSDWFQSNRLRIHWSMILDLLHYSTLLDLLHFFGLSDLSDGKSLKNLKKVGPWVYMVLLAWKWAPTWLKLIIWPTFITYSIFPIKLLKNSLSFGKIKI